MEKPQNVSIGVNLQYLSLTLGLLIAYIDPVGAMHKVDPVVAVAILGVIFLILAFLIFMISLGQNWARILFLVLFVLGVVPTIMGIPKTLNISLAAGMLSTIQLVLQAVSAVLFFTPSAGPWFRR